MLNEKQYLSQGSEAYRKGSDELDNPYDIFDTHEWEAANTWQHGFRMEREYWENLAGEEDENNITTNND
jgi:hypothetical protein